MTKWDRCGDGQGGTYGYNEPAVCLATTFRHRYALQKRIDGGTLTVNVKDDQGLPVAGATVLVDEELAGTTDSNGTVTMASVPAGPHQVKAQRYTGPSLPGVKLQLTEDEILALPDCPARLMCKAVTCPSGWNGTEAYANVTLSTDANGPVISRVHACYPTSDPRPDVTS